MAAEPSPQRGEVWLVVLDPAVGGKPWRTKSTTASKRRLQRLLGGLGKGDLDAVTRVVRLQLGF